MRDGLKKGRELTFLGVAALCLLYGLWGGSLLDSDDVIYADIARTMWRTGQFLELRWHDAVLFEKPPLLFWVLSWTGGALGFSDFAMRIPGALAGLAALFAIGPLFVALGGRGRRFLAPAFLLVSYSFVFHSRRVLADPLFVLAMYGFILLWVRACLNQSESERGCDTRLGFLAGICLGVCVMIKWVFVLLPILAVAAWHLVERRRVPAAAFVRMLLALAVVALPWHVYQSIQYGAGFWEVYAGYHVLERATRSLVSPTTPSFYLELFGETDAGFLAIVGIGLVGSVWGWKEGDRRSISAWAMVAAVFLPLQLSSTKMPHYILAILPALAVAAALGWEVLLLRFRSLPVRLGLLFLLVLSFLGGPLSHVNNPDYSPTVKLACEKAAEGSNPVILMNTYSPAATWYCDAQVPMYTDDERFYAVQQSIDMMARSGAVEKVESVRLRQLVLENPMSPVVTRRGNGLHLRKSLPVSHMSRDVRSLGDADMLVPPTQ